MSSLPAAASLQWQWAQRRLGGMALCMCTPRVCRSWLSQAPTHHTPGRPARRAHTSVVPNVGTQMASTCHCAPLLCRPLCPPTATSTTCGCAPDRPCTAAHLCICMCARMCAQAPDPDFPPRFVQLHPTTHTHTCPPCTHAALACAQCAQHFGGDLATFTSDADFQSVLAILDRAPQFQTPLVFGTPTTWLGAGFSNFGGPGIESWRMVTDPSGLGFPLSNATSWGIGRPMDDPVLGPQVCCSAGHTAAQGSRECRLHRRFRQTLQRAGMWVTSCRPARGAFC